MTLILIKGLRLKRKSKNKEIDTTVVSISFSHIATKDEHSIPTYCVLNTPGYAYMFYPIYTAAAAYVRPVFLQDIATKNKNGLMTFTHYITYGVAATEYPSRTDGQVRPVCRYCDKR